MQHGGKADHRGGAPHQRTHGVSALIGVGVHLRQRAVVPDGAGQHKGNIALHAAVQYAVVDMVVLNKLGDRAAAALPVQHVQMVVVAVGLAALGVDVLSQRRMETGGLQIVGAQGVARQQAVAVAVFDHGLHGGPCPGVKGEGGPHDPDDAAMVTLVAQQRRQLVVILGVGRFAAASLTEHELVVIFRFLLRREAIAVQVDALLAPLGAAQQHPVALLEIPGLHRVQTAIRPQNDAGIHAAFLRQTPLAVDLAVLRVHGGAVEILGGYAVPLRRLPPGVRRGGKAGLGKIGMVVHGQFKRHDAPPLSFSFYTYTFFVLRVLTAPAPSHAPSAWAAPARTLRRTTPPGGRCGSLRCTAG